MKVLQALHIACRDPPDPGKPFFPDADAIFNETLIAGPAPPSTGTGGSGGLHGWHLAVAIALPIVGGIILIGGFCWGCFAFTRKRRYRMAQSGRMSRVHDAHADSSYQSPLSAKAEAWKHDTLPWGVVEPPREMHAISPTLLHTGKQHSPGFAQGRWSHQTGGTGATSEQHTPLRSSFQRDDVGPGPAQVKDPNLHEQYFGVAGEDEAEDGRERGHEHEVPMPGPSGVGVAVGEGYYPHTEGQYGYAQSYGPEYGHEPGHGQGQAQAQAQAQAHGHGQLRVHEDERGQFI
jgi:hypothetical protein